MSEAHWNEYERRDLERRGLYDGRVFRELDGGSSPACAEHGLEILVPEARAHVLHVHPTAEGAG